MDIETLRFIRYIVDMGAGFTLSLAALFALLVALRARRGDTDVQRRMLDVLAGFQTAIGEQTSAAREQIRAIERLGEATTTSAQQASSAIATLDASVRVVDVDVKALRMEVERVAPTIVSRLDEHQRALLEQLAPIPEKLSEMYILLREASHKIDEHHRETGILIATQQRVAGELASIHALVREVFEIVSQPTKEQERGDNNTTDERDRSGRTDPAAEPGERRADVPRDAHGAHRQGEGADHGAS